MIETEHFQRCVITNGVIAKDTKRVDLIDLATELVLSFDRDLISEFLLPDDQISKELRLLGISGLRSVGNLSSTEGSLPLAGNFNDPSWLSICLGGKCDSKCSFCYTEFISQ
jgi:hypothetical protein